MKPSEVAEFLRAHNFHPGTIQAVGHGEWSTAYFARAQNSELVVRFSATDEDFGKDRWVMAHAVPGLPVPNVFEVGEAFGGFYALSERAFGEYIEARDAEAMRRLLPSLFATLDAMRAVDVTETTGFGVWRADGSAPHASWHAFLNALASDSPSTRTSGSRERLASVPEAYEVFVRGFSAMQDLAPFCPNERYLVHSDLLNFNVLVTNDRLSCVLDWGSSLLGDFLWDLAWFTLWQPWYTAWASVDIRGAALEHFFANGLELEHFDERMRCYELAIGLDGMAYQAFVGHRDELAWTTARVRSLLAS